MKKVFSLILTVLMLAGAAARDADALVGWELKAALLAPQIEKIFGADP